MWIEFPDVSRNLERAPSCFQGLFTKLVLTLLPICRRSHFNIDGLGAAFGNPEEDRIHPASFSKSGSLLVLL